MYWSKKLEIEVFILEDRLRIANCTLFAKHEIVSQMNQS